MTGLDLGLADIPALVTGGGSGIGRATARRLGENGASVAVVDIDAEAARATAEDIIAHGGKAIALAADVSCEKDVLAAAADAEAALGVIRVLVNNAGIGERRPMLDIPLDDWKMVLDVNLTAVFLFTQVIARRMVSEGGGGAIVNVASVAGLNGGGPAFSHYAAAKAGIIGFTKALSHEFARLGITANAIAPGLIDVHTNGAADMLFNRDQRNAKPQPLVHFCPLLSRKHTIIPGKRATNRQSVRGTANQFGTSARLGGSVQPARRSIYSTRWYGQPPRHCPRYRLSVANP